MSKNFDNKTIMAHKLAAMRLVDPKLTESSAVNRILIADSEDNRMEMDEYERFREYVTYQVRMLWDGKPEAN